MSDDTLYPGATDGDIVLDQDAMAGGKENDLDGTGSWRMSKMLRRLQTGLVAVETYGASVIAKRAGATVSNTSSATSLLASTISVPAILRAGSQLEVCHRGIATLNSGSPTVTFTALLGGVSYDLGTTTALTASANPRQYVMRLLFTANTASATADMHLQGEWRITTATTSAFDVNQVSVFGGTSHTVDTTSAMTFDLKVTMSVANAADTVLSGLTTIAHTPYIG